MFHNTKNETNGNTNLKSKDKNRRIMVKKWCLCLMLVGLFAASLPMVDASADFPTLPQIDATSSPSVAVAPGGAAYAFVRGADNALWYSVRSGNQWTEWQSQGGMMTSAPDCVAPVSSQITCVVRGPDNGMWVKTANVTGNGLLWGDWQPQGGVLSSGPSVAAVVGSGGNIELQAFVKGPSEALWAKRFNGTQWGNWFQSPNVSFFQNDPDCTWRGFGEFDCVVLSAGDDVMHNDGCCLNTQGALWENLGGDFIHGPSITSRTQNSFDVFVHGPNDNLWWRTEGGNSRLPTWTEIDVNGDMASGPDCDAVNTEVVLCAYLSQEGNVKSVDLFLGN